MKLKSLLSGLLIGVVTLANAQQIDMTNVDPPGPLDIPIQPSLHEVVTNLEVNPERAREVIDTYDMTIREGKFNLRVYHSRNYEGIPQNLVDDHNIEVYKVGMNFTCVWMFPEDIISLAENLPEGYVITQDYKPEVHNEGVNPDVHNSILYRDNGPGGTGIEIAIIDVGFNGLANAISNGRAPASYDSVDMTGGSGILNGSAHGVAVTETVFDHAPNATYTLYKVTNSSECENAIIDAHNDGVDVMNMSLGWSSLGWTDDASSLCTAANDAANDGILLFISAGNSRMMHWQGAFEDDNTNGWHEWSGNDELNNITLPDSTGISVNLIWNTAGGTDYNLYIYDVVGPTLLASNVQAGTTFEFTSFTNNSGLTRTVAISVWKASGPAAELEISCRGSGNGSSVTTDQLQYFVPASSIQWPAACSAPNVIGVAGVIDDDFTSPPGSIGINEVYSSEGPTNDGGYGVDITGATRTTVGSGGSFFGTSCAAPNCTGATAALWSSQIFLDADQIMWLINKKAGMYNDWGAVGVDPIYGYGGLRLYDYIENTKYVDRVINNPGGAFNKIFQYVSHAHAALPSPPAEGAILIFGNNYPSPYTPLNWTTSKAFIMRSLKTESTLGNN